MLKSFSILRKKLLFLLCFFLLWLLVFISQKIVFLLVYDRGFSHVLSVTWHGLPLDISMAAYLSTMPALLLLLSGLPLRIFHTERGAQLFLQFYRCWVTICAIIVSLAFTANCALYKYWGFPLDATPIFFITSSPTDAIASVEWWQALLGLFSTLCVFLLTCWLFRFLRKSFDLTIFKHLGMWTSIIMLLFVASLFLPIRGGISVSSMNTGRVYFSDNQTLNHAAVNPLFSLMESLAHQKDFANMYRFMDNDMARKLASTLTRPSSSAPKTMLTTKRPDIYLVILESFSDTIMKTKGVTPNLNKLKEEGLYFSRFYANSFRTDRGLVSILLGYPSPSTVSLMKFPNKTAAIPSLSEHLKKAGWSLKYYYGGDADFTNMRSFLVNQGFNDIVEDVNFPVSDRMSKWGVPDHLLFRRVQADMREERSAKPIFHVIQTSSSHEPFDVPSHRLKDKALNAFLYTDSCLGAFVKHLKSTRRWNNSLVILVPDHLGAWPYDIDNFASWRYHIPMIWTGGAISSHTTVNTYASQQDIAATLLSQLGLSHRDLRFSKDIFNELTPHFAYFMINDGFGFINDDNELIYDHHRDKAVVDIGNRKGQNLSLGKAYTQILFDDIASR
ncbi:phosphoglycerol transferase MdoB-like AlkP superfamily enzyme [Hallella colorans]|uniref:Phosphoglycerol transferase MdoB-like AlkP superfamily enzyme n=2 Tax=Hallella colorans TaxID=1703337 RepID=A0A2U0U7V2_9BACT|nr:LTA synthase family protein [Hallella colorans]PVX53706.1 phosphoglycerol transferase MdoB-like AlkP superfamily enzyme [Hallella colorans]